MTTFPESILPIVAELQLDGEWTDITSDVRSEQRIVIRRGRSAEATATVPATCTLTLSNAAGKYSMRNPRSPYFGKLGRNTPLRVSVDAGDPFLSINDAAADRATTPDAAVLDITGDLDLRVDARLEHWDSSTAQCLIGKYDGLGDERSYRLVTQNRNLFLAWSTLGTDFIERTPGVDVPLTPSRRLAVRATLDVDDDDGSHVATFYTAETIAGPWVQLGDPVTTSGTTSIHAGTAPLEVGHITSQAFLAPLGEILAAEVRDGIDGTVVANPDFTAQTVGDTSFTDDAGLTWTLAGDASVSNRRTRFTGEVAEWPARWDTGGLDVTAPITASGILRRLKQGSKPLDSTLRHRIPSDPDVLAYWPMEEGADAARAYSPLSGVQPMTATDMTWAADSSLAGSNPLPTVATGSRLSAVVPAGDGTGWHVEFVYRFDGDLPSGRTTFWRVTLTGSRARYVYVQASSTNGVRVLVTDEDNTEIASGEGLDGLDDFHSGDWNRLQIFTQADGSDTVVFARWIQIGGDSTSFVGSTAAAFEPGHVAETGMPAIHEEFSGMAVGQLAVFDTASTLIFNSADHGFEGETALSRLVRVAGEQTGFPDFTWYDGDQTIDSERVGGQRPATVLSVLQDAADVDGGILYERRDLAELAYRDRSGMYNQTPAMTLSYSGDGLVAPLDPVDDDQVLRNDVTVTREGGSSGRAVLEEGPLSTQAPPDGVGVYDTAVTLPLHADSQAPLQAGWLMHLGTVDEARYPRVVINLANAPHMITDAVVVDVGDRMQITDLPDFLPPEAIDLIVQGYTETLSQYEWTVEYTCTPASAWTVGVVGDATLGRVDTDGSELADAAAKADTLLRVLTAGPGWVVAAPALNDNPRAETDLTGWTQNNAAIERTAAPAPATAPAAYAIQVTPNGTSSSGGVNGSHATAGTVTPGEEYTASCWAYSPGGSMDLRACIDWYDSSDSFLSSSLGSASTVAAGTWTLLEQTLTAPASADRASVRARRGSTPAATDVWWATQITIRPARDGELPGEFPFDVSVAGEQLRVEAVDQTGAYDGFGRTVTSGWRRADSGQAWTASGGSTDDFLVDGTTGVHQVDSLNVSRFCLLPAVATADVDLLVDVSTEEVAAGDSMQAYLIARYQDSSNYYGARLDFTADQEVTVTMIKVVAGAAASFTTHTTSITHEADTPVRLRFQIEGSSLRARAWLTTDTEPATWQVTQTDTSLTAAGQIGVRSRFLSSVSNTLPVDVQFGRFAATQVMTVVRSINSISKALTSGEDLALTYPAIVPL